MFRQVVHRIAMFTAIAAVTGGLFTPCQADINLNTPSGLTPGETFRFVFETDGTTTATSTNITDYDNFVNAQADGATYAGIKVTWQAIGSTSSVDAITHIGVNPTISGVYLVTGQQVATGDGTSAGELWGKRLEIPINVDIESKTLSSALNWTGTTYAGTAYPSRWLGTTILPNAIVGTNVGIGQIWVAATYQPLTTPSPCTRSPVSSPSQPPPYQNHQAGCWR